MLMLAHAQSVTRDDLARIATPEPTPTWTPVAHHEVVTTLIDRAAARGLTVRAEKYAVLSGALHPTPGERIDLPGARLFGSLDFKPIPGMPFPEGCSPSAGIRNSHDKTFALSLLSGARVFVCANGVLSAEHVISRKHTSGLDLTIEIDRALDAFTLSIQEFNVFYGKLRDWRLSRTKAHSLTVELAQAGAFASGDILPVIQEYENPRHDAFREKSGWSLYNAATERMKTQSPARQLLGFKALNAVVSSYLN